MQTDPAIPYANWKQPSRIADVACCQKGLFCCRTMPVLVWQKFAKICCSTSDGKFSITPLQPRPVALRFPCVRATKKSTEGTPVHTQRWGPRNHWRMVSHATQDFLRWRYPSSRGPMGHLFQPTRRLRVDSRQLHRYCICTTLQFIIYTWI